MFFCKNKGMYMRACIHKINNLNSQACMYVQIIERPVFIRNQCSHTYDCCKESTYIYKLLTDIIGSYTSIMLRKLIDFMAAEILT